MLYPQKDDVLRKLKQGEPQLIWSTLTTDLITPVAALMHVQDISPHHILLESVEGGEAKGRYSVIALDPDAIWNMPEAGSPFESLRTFIAEAKLDIPDELPPMAAGVFGYMTYDMVKYMESLPDENPDTIGIPKAVYFRPRVTIVFDNVKDQAYICSPIYPDTSTPEQAYEKAALRIQQIKERLNQPLKHHAAETAPLGEITSHISKPDYMTIVEQAKEYIRAGDIFQIVPSRRLSASFSHHPLSLYRALRHLNPSPYLFYLNINDYTLIGSSPEILVKLEGDTVTIRPIAGTRPRGKNETEDQLLEQELLHDEKEIAEHLMLLDLGRNDVGRVAQKGTVNVTEQMSIERYSHVMHIVSNVEGKIDQGKDAIDALIAGFPAGTTSGAPKIRAMEIIDELEKEKRSFYAGTVGYFSANGDMDTCIALRTALVKDHTLYIQAGGGVVADSDPESEFHETENKAGAIIAAAKQAHNYQ